MLVALLESSISETKFLKQGLNRFLGANFPPSQDGTTPLFMACQNGHIDVVNILLANGADVNLTGFKVSEKLRNIAQCFKQSKK